MTQNGNQRPNHTIPERRKHRLNDFDCTPFFALPFPNSESAQSRYLRREHLPTTGRVCTRHFFSILGHTHRAVLVTSSTARGFPSSSSFVDCGSFRVL